MTTSNSVDFSVSRNDLIEHALKHIGALGDGETPSATQYTEGAILLNMLVKSKMADGMPLWALKTGYVLPTTGVSSVSLGPTGGNATLSYNQTTTSAAAVLGASTIVVTSATGFTNTYYIGIELDDDTMQWTTINGVPSGTTITLTDTLTAAVASGAKVYVYQTKLQRPLRIIDTHVYDIVNGTDYLINYTNYPDKLLSTDTGVPNQVYYDPQLVDGVLHIYPRFISGDYILRIRFHRPFEDFDASSDTPDFPQEYYLPLMISLAYLLAPKNGLPLDERKLLLQESKMVWDQALGNGTEEGSIFFSPTGR